MGHEFQWPPADDDLQAHILVLPGETVEVLQPRREPDVTHVNRVGVRAGDPVAGTHGRAPHVTQVGVAAIEPSLVELALNDWPQEFRPAATFQAVTTDRMAPIDPTPTGPPGLGPPRSSELIASRHRHRFGTYVATVAVSMVCASVATSYVERHEVFGPSVDAIGKLVGPELNRSATVTRPQPSPREVPAASSVAASLAPAALSKKQVEPVRRPAEPPQKLKGRDMSPQSAPSRRQGSVPPPATRSRLGARIGLDARLDRRAIPTVTSRSAATSPKVRSSDSSDRSVKSPEAAVISTTPKTVVRRGGIADDTPPSAPVAPPAPISLPPTVVAPLPASAVPARNALAEVASPTPAPPLAPPAGASVVPTRVQEEQNIQRVLQRYALAYEQLDANAAKVVWPTLDVRALTRAFEGLESQNLRFSGCELSISGAEAKAVCHGTATYVPKIGSKEPRTSRRDWVFKLKKLETDWRIAQSETR
jgi:hypothetical protein